MKNTEKNSAKISSTKTNDLSVNTVKGAGQLLTTNQGLKINDNNNSLKAGKQGPTLLEDFILRETHTHFDHERIYKHCKAIATGADSTALLKETYVKEIELTDLNMEEAVLITEGNANKFKGCVAKHRFWNREEFRKVSA